MLDLLKRFLDTVNLLITFFTSTIQSLVDLFRNIPTYIAFLGANINLLPNILIPFCLASVSIFVLHFVLGREN